MRPSAHLLHLVGSGDGSRRRGQYSWGRACSHSVSTWRSPPRGGRGTARRCGGACGASVLVRLRRLGNARLKANGAAGRSPGGWKDLEFLRKEVKTHGRVFEGKSNLCPELLLGYASVLGIDSQECFPDTEAWIAEAAVYLARCGGARQITVEDARVYVHQVVPLVAERVQTSADIEARLGGIPGEVRAVVMAVATALAPVLEQNDPETRRTAG